MSAGFMIPAANVKRAVAKKARANGKKARRRHEALIQESVCQYLALHERLGRLLWFAIPNGGSRHIAEAVKFVGTGTRKGVPDIMLPAANDKYHGMFIELKVGKNKTSKAQDEWIDALRANGYYVVVCYTWNVARAAIIAYLENKI